MGGQDCDGSTLPQAPIGSRPIRSDGLPCPSPTDDDRQISSEDRRSVKLRVRPPPAGTHQCHRATSAGSGMMLTVKLTQSSSIDPQDTGLQPVANPPCWASRTAANLNLTMPARTPLGTSPFVRLRTFPLPVVPTRANVDGRRLPAAATTRRTRVHAGFKGSSQHVLAGVRVGVR